MKSKDRQIILRVNTLAEKNLFQKGLNGWSMNSLAEACGITKRTLYRIIPNKEALLEKILLAKMEKVQKEISLLFQQNLPFDETLIQGISQFAHSIGELQTTLMADVLKEYPGIEQTMLEKRDRLTTLCRNFIEQGRQRGKLRAGINPAELLEMLQVLTLHYIKTEKVFPVGEKLKTVLETVLYGVLPQ